MDEKITTGELLEQALEWFKFNYDDYFAERDIVCVFQRKLKETITQNNLSFRVYHNFQIGQIGQADLVMLNEKNEIELAIEFKYEPDRQRERIDFWPTKLPVVASFKEVEKEVKRVKLYVNQKKAKSAVIIFVDEGGRYRHMKPPTNTEWIDYDCVGKRCRKIAVLLGHFT
jgi:hypothetical protein